MAWTATESAGDGFIERPFAFDAPTSGSWIPGVYRTPEDGGRRIGSCCWDTAERPTSTRRTSWRWLGSWHNAASPRWRSMDQVTASAQRAGAAPGLEWLARVWEDGGGTNGVISDLG